MWPISSWTVSNENSMATIAEALRLPLNTPLGSPLLFSVGVHLVVIFGVILSPSVTDPSRPSDQAVTFVLTPSAQIPDESYYQAAENQQGLATAKPQLMAAVSGLSVRGPAAESTDIATERSAALSNNQPSALASSDTVAARAALDAAYISRWQAQVERFGNTYYRDAAQRYGDGDVRLLVQILADGSLLGIQVLESSGISALDRAAINTVEQLAPYAPFDAALAREVKQLDIVRTWQFRE